MLLDGADLAGVPPYRRPVNMMFQSYALFPHMTVAGNVAFGLKQDGLPKDEIAARVDEMLALVQLSALGARKPDQLSGGQRQRVALARSLAKRPKVLLLDEPLAALDRKLREETRFELKELQRRLETTFVIVTHDQDEAMTVADRIAVMDRGRIAQVGTPAEIYERPNSRWVADFVGDVNLIEGTRHGESIRLRRVRAAKACACGCASGDGCARHDRVRSRCGRRRSASRMTMPDGAAPRTAPPASSTDIGYLGTLSLYKVRLDGGLVSRSRSMNESRQARAHDRCERPRVAVVDARGRRAADANDDAQRPTPLDHARSRSCCPTRGWSRSSCCRS